jgi:hypothetical protein
MTLPEILTHKLPPGPPWRRLELYLAMEQVLVYVRTIGRPVILRPTDAPKVGMAARMRGIPLPLLAVRTAIEQLTRR